MEPTHRRASWLTSLSHASGTALSFTSDAALSTLHGVTSAASAAAQGVSSAATATGQGAATAAAATAGLAAATATALVRAPGAVASATLQLPGLLYHGSVDTLQGLVHLQDPQRMEDVRAPPPRPAAAAAYPLSPAAWLATRAQWRAHWSAMLARALPEAEFAALLPGEDLVLRSEWAAMLLADAVARMEDLLDLVAEVAHWSACGSLLKYALQGVLGELSRQGGEDGSEAYFQDSVEAFRGACLAAVRELHEAVLAKERDHLQALIKGSGLAAYVPEFAVGMAQSKATGLLLSAAAGPFALAASVGLQASKSLCATSHQSALFHSLAVKAFAVFKDLVTHLSSSSSSSSSSSQERCAAVEKARLAARYQLLSVAERLAAAASSGSAASGAGEEAPPQQAPVAGSGAGGGGGGVG